MFVRSGEGLRERIVVRDVRLRGREREGGGGMSKVSTRPARRAAQGAPRSIARRTVSGSRVAVSDIAKPSSRRAISPARAGPTREAGAREVASPRAPSVWALSPGGRAATSGRLVARPARATTRRERAAALHSPPAIRVAIARRQRGWKPAGARLCARGEEGRGTRFPNPVLAAVGCDRCSLREGEQQGPVGESSVGRISARRVERGNEIDSYTCRGETLNLRVIFCVFACCASRFRGFIGLAGQTRGFDRGLAMNARKNLPIRVSLHREILSEVAWKMTKIAEKTQISEATTRASFA